MNVLKKTFAAAAILASLVGCGPPKINPHVVAKATPDWSITKPDDWEVLQPGENLSGLKDAKTELLMRSEVEPHVGLVVNTIKWASQDTKDFAGTMVTSAAQNKSFLLVSAAPAKVAYKHTHIDASYMIFIVAVDEDSVYRVQQLSVLHPKVGHAHTVMCIVSADADLTLDEVACMQSIESFALN